ncbi:MAG: hypothetical protein KJ072_15820 [Verrucomicrobia bacterium]|nr:hypothetical protein [Verrucomicrobiota bacterium]
MSGSRILPHFVGALILALAVYAGAFWLDQHLRTRRGPWQVTFDRMPDGTPTILIQQQRLGIREVRILFPGESTAAESTSIRFDAPGLAVPWGRLKYDDLTYLPGVVTLELFGHEIELLPRTLYVNRRAIAWNAATNLTLRASDRPATLPEPGLVKRGRLGNKPDATER